jgi:hypothetical protein
MEISAALSGDCLLEVQLLPDCEKPPAGEYLIASNIGIHPFPGTIMDGLMISLILVSALHAGPDSLEGRYTFDPAASDDPAEVAREASQGVGRMARGRMRSALEEALTPSPTLEIRMEGEAYLIIGQEGRALRVVPGGPEIEQETPQGEEARISAFMKGETLEIRIRTSRAERIQTLTPAEAIQTLTPTEAGLRMVNTFIMDRLPEPVRMEVVYLRVEASGEVAQ